MKGEIDRVSFIIFQKYLRGTPFNANRWSRRSIRSYSLSPYCNLRPHVQQVTVELFLSTMQYRQSKANEVLQNVSEAWRGAAHYTPICMLSTPPKEEPHSWKDNCGIKLSQIGLTRKIHHLRIHCLRDWIHQHWISTFIYYVCLFYWKVRSEI